MIRFLFIFCLFLIGSYEAENSLEKVTSSNQPYIYILGVAQDAGYPQINCEKECCKRVYDDASNKRFVSSIALVDPISNEEWVFDATPDFSNQVKLLNDQTKRKGDLPEGIF